MTFLSSIEIMNFRNIDYSIINLCDRFNVFYGENGSGKTSLLEAIYHFGYGRSFRTHLYQHVIQKEKGCFLLFGKENKDGRSIGIERERNGNIRIRSKNKEITSTSEIAIHFPIQLINPDSYQLLDAGPKRRRQFIDWGLFHVEQPNFLNSWKNLLRILKQRNASLKEKHNKERVLIWNKGLIECTDRIHQLRVGYISKYIVIFTEILKKVLFEFSEIELSYYPGWDEKKGYKEALFDSLDKDIQYGYTQYGPHKADLRITLNRIPVENVLSRGQQKILVCIMQLSQAILLRKEKDRKCIFLIDDLPSELDEKRRGQIIELLNDMDSQVFLTGIEKEPFKVFNVIVDKGKLFHVKHGVITEDNFH